MSDLRIGDLIGSALKGNDTPRAALVGFPSDAGVKRNNGRPGANRGPQAAREVFLRMRLDPERYDAHHSLISQCIDLGDLSLSDEVESDQALLAETIAPLLEAGTIPIILGGGHETSYGHFLGYVSHKASISVCNWDGHADVKELVDGKGHSGSPFRQALEHSSGLCAQYAVAGLLRHNVPHENFTFLQAKNSRIIWGDQIHPGTPSELYGAISGDYFASFDLDVLDPAYAPGVSNRSPASGGLDPQTWLIAARLAGSDGSCRSIDIVELNPEFDRDNQTAKLAGLTVWQFLYGLLDR